VGCLHRRLLDGIQWRTVEQLFREQQCRYDGGIALQVLNTRTAADLCVCASDALAAKRRHLIASVPRLVIAVANARLFFRPKCDGGHRLSFSPSLLSRIEAISTDGAHGRQRSCGRRLRGLTPHVAVKLNLPTQSKVPHASHHFHPVLRDCLDLDSGMRLCAKGHAQPGNRRTLPPVRGLRGLHAPRAADREFKRASS
jgi:hypothetical protein